MLNKIFGRKDKNKGLENQEKNEFELDLRMFWLHQN